MLRQSHRLVAGGEPRLLKYVRAVRAASASAVLARAAERSGHGWTCRVTVSHADRLRARLVSGLVDEPTARSGGSPRSSAIPARSAAVPVGARRRRQRAAGALDTDTLGDLADQPIERHDHFGSPLLRDKLCKSENAFP